MSDTIFAVSSGAAPAAIAVIRISGPAAFSAGRALAGTLPAPRRAGRRRLRNANGAALDDALVLAFPGPATATGEDIVELHCHGGRAIVRAVAAALARQPGLRQAEPGEFTRQALGNGRIDLAQAEGLADLIAADTEAARRAAFDAAEGGVSRAVAGWQERIVALSARTEALLDFADEDDVAADPTAVRALQNDVAQAAADIAMAAARPAVERLRDGIRIVLAGPPNSGKSTLLNALVDRDVAIATPFPGTTRDRLEAPVVRDGRVYLFVDVAGLRDRTDDPIEEIGIERARSAIAAADLVIWLGDVAPPDPNMLAIWPRCDLAGRQMGGDRLPVSAATGAGIDALWSAIAARADDLLPRSDETAFNERQRIALSQAAADLSVKNDDLLLIAERLRLARHALATITGQVGIEPVLDALFGRFCVGK